MNAVVADGGTTNGNGLDRIAADLAALERVTAGCRAAAQSCIAFLDSGVLGPDLTAATQLAALRELSVAIDEALDIADPVDGTAS